MCNACVLELICEFGDQSSRVDCGNAGIHPVTCVHSGCCWGHTVWGTPWCFKKTRMYTAKSVDVCDQLMHGRVVPRSRTQFGDRSFAVAGPRVWNSLPAPLRDTNGIYSFRKQLKTFLFSGSARYKYSYLLTYFALVHPTGWGFDLIYGPPVERKQNSCS